MDPSEKFVTRTLKEDHEEEDGAAGVVRKGQHTVGIMGEPGKGWEFKMLKDKGDDVRDEDTSEQPAIGGSQTFT